MDIGPGRNGEDHQKPGVAMKRRTDGLMKDGFKPSTPLEVGIKKFIEWPRECYL